MKVQSTKRVIEVQFANVRWLEGVRPANSWSNAGWSAWPWRKPRRVHINRSFGPAAGGDDREPARTQRMMPTTGHEVRGTAEGKGNGVFATRAHQQGETVMVGVIERRLTGNTAHATQVGRSEWVQLAGLGPMVNHSCDPNCGIRMNSGGAPDLVARRAIALGEEITFDYAMRNYSVEQFPARCRCGASLCRGSVTGWKDLPLERKAAYGRLVAPYLLEVDRQAGAR